MNLTISCFFLYGFGHDVFWYCVFTKEMCCWVMWYLGIGTSDC